MSAAYPGSDAQDRLHDLLTLEFGCGLEPGEEKTLRELLGAPGASHESDAFEAAAASTALGFAAQDFEPMPASLRARCLRAGEELWNAAPQPSPAQAPVPQTRPLRFTQPMQPPARSGVSGMLGWLAAAACLAFAVVSWWPSSRLGAGSGSPGIIPVASPEVLREQLVKEAADLVSWRWQAWGDQYAGVTGDVVWSEARQEGYMLLSGLPANDPNREQYQLWIVESSRGTPLQTEPVDGGVFDVADAGTVVIPIRAALPSFGVAAFGVTLEPAGGVVVSDQQRRVVIAAPPPTPDPDPAPAPSSSSGTDSGAGSDPSDAG